MTYYIDLYGPPGAGKTVTLASWYETLPAAQRLSFEVSKGILEQRERILRRDSDPTPPEADESVTLTWKSPAGAAKFQIRSHAGESTMEDGGSVHAERFRDRFIDGKRLLVVALNPFTCDEQLAMLGMRSLVSHLQAREDMVLPTAFRVAARALLSVSAGELSKDYPEVEELLDSPDLAGACIKHDATGGGHTFRWDGIARPELADALDLALQELVRRVVSQSKPFRDQMSEAARRLTNCVVLLTHVDLLQMMPGVHRHDFDPVFDTMFHDTPDLRERQKLFQASLELRIVRRSPARISPWGFDSQAYRTLTNLLEYAVSRSREAESPKQTKVPEPVVARSERAVAAADYFQHFSGTFLMVFSACLLLLVLGNLGLSMGGWESVGLLRLLGSALILAIVASAPIAAWSYFEQGRIERLDLAGGQFDAAHS